MSHLLRSTGAAVLAVLGTLALLMATSQPAVSAGSTTPPAPTGLRVTDHDATTVELAWSSTEPLDGYTTFNVYADGVLVYVSTATSAHVAGFTPGTTVEFRVTVKRPDRGDRVGLESARSAPVRVSFDSDSTPPPTPANLRLTGRTPQQLGFVWTTTQDDNGAAPRYELSFPGGQVLVDGYRTWATAPLAGLDLSPGREYAFELRAIDAAGNRSAVPARFTFETTPPGVATGLRQVSTRAGFPERIEWTAAPDDGGIQSYDVVLNGEVIGATGTAAPSVDLFELIFNVACIDPPSGPATLQVRAVDASFNSGALSAPLTLQFP
jgi:hypothetical protein